MFNFASGSVYECFSPPSFVASAQDKSKGVMTMQRKINSTHVVGYAQHIPNEEVELNKVEHMEYHDAELIRANGTVSCKLMTEVIPADFLYRMSSSTQHIHIPDHENSINCSRSHLRLYLLSLLYLSCLASRRKLWSIYTLMVVIQVLW